MAMHPMHSGDVKVADRQAGLKERLRARNGTPKLVGRHADKSMRLASGAPDIIRRMCCDYKHAG
jgi:hypothetical protein